MTRATRSGRLTKSKFESTCAETGKTIKRGDACLYLPENKVVFHIESKEAIAFKNQLTNS
jgi:hypothetical protein